MSRGRPPKATRRDSGASRGASSHRLSSRSTIVLDTSSLMVLLVPHHASPSSLSSRLAATLRARPPRLRAPHVKLMTSSSLLIARQSSTRLRRQAEDEREGMRESSWRGRDGRRRALRELDEAMVTL